MTSGISDVKELRGAMQTLHGVCVCVCVPVHVSVCVLACAPGGTSGYVNRWV